MATLDPGECLQLLSLHDIGRIALIDGSYPVVFPVNYRLTALSGRAVIALRTREGGALDHLDAPVGFQIDGVSPGHDAGWSVLVRGRLAEAAPTAGFDPRPIPDDERDAWRIIVPAAISGRRLHSDPMRWPFLPAAYV